MLVHVDARSVGVGLVEELAGEWVASGVGDVVVGQVDDLVAGNAVCKHDLDGVMGVGLMTVVAVGVRSSHDDSPVVGGVDGGGDGGESSGGSEGFHV